MDSTTLSFSVVSSILGAGTIATAVMSLFVLLFSGTAVLPLNPLMVIGSMVTSSRIAAPRFGAVMHFAVGILAAFLYAVLLRATGFVSAAMPIAGATLIGFIHGYVMSFILVISLGENGASPGIRKQGMAQAGVYLVAHVLFGASLGLMFMVLPAALQ